MNCIPSEVCPSIDWLTLTATDAAKSLELAKLGHTLVQLSASHDNKAEPWHWRDYVGEHCEGVSWGERPDSVILQLSGPYADEWFTTAYKHSTNCSRIDLAVSVKYEPEREGVGDGIYRSGCEWADKRGTGPGYTLISDSSGGSTCYIGARVSDLFGRVYDKRRESGDKRWQGYWRWEVECKGEIASRCASSLDSCAARTSQIVGTVRNYFARRGCEPDWGMGEPDYRMVHIRPVSTVASRLQWLTAQVRPAVQWLAAQGYETQVYEAIGLPVSTSTLGRIRSKAGHGHHTNEVGDEF